MKTEIDVTNEAIMNDNTSAVALPALPRYEVGQDKTNRWVVVRFGPKGGKRVIMTYANTDMGHTAAITLATNLGIWAGDE